MPLFTDDVFVRVSVPERVADAAQRLEIKLVRLHGRAHTRNAHMLPRDSTGLDHIEALKTITLVTTGYTGPVGSTAKSTAHIQFRRVRGTADSVLTVKFKGNELDTAYMYFVRIRLHVRAVSSQNDALHALGGSLVIPVASFAASAWQRYDYRTHNMGASTRSSETIDPPADFNTHADEFIAVILPIVARKYTTVQSRCYSATAEASIDYSHACISVDMPHIPCHIVGGHGAVESAESGSPVSPSVPLSFLFAANAAFKYELSGLLRFSLAVLGLTPDQAGHHLAKTTSATAGVFATYWAVIAAASLPYATDSKCTDVTPACYVGSGIPDSIDPRAYETRYADCEDKAALLLQLLMTLLKYGPDSTDPLVRAAAAVLATYDVFFTLCTINEDPAIAVADTATLVPPVDTTRDLAKQRYSGHATVVALPQGRLINQRDALARTGLLLDPVNPFVPVPVITLQREGNTALFARSLSVTASPLHNVRATFGTYFYGLCSLSLVRPDPAYGADLLWYAGIPATGSKSAAGPISFWSILRGDRHGAHLKPVQASVGRAALPQALLYFAELFVAGPYRSYREAAVDGVVDMPPIPSRVVVTEPVWGAEAALRVGWITGGRRGIARLLDTDTAHGLVVHHSDLFPLAAVRQTDTGRIFD
jgi:hypothetical protein